MAYRGNHSSIKHRSVRLDKNHENYWISANIIESIFYFAVPVFFMISGCTLIDYRNKYSTKIYFKKRINKTLIPFIIWSMLALLYIAKIPKTIIYV